MGQEGELSGMKANIALKEYFFIYCIGVSELCSYRSNKLNRATQTMLILLNPTQRSSPTVKPESTVKDLLS